MYNLSLTGKTACSEEFSEDLAQSWLASAVGNWTGSKLYPSPGAHCTGCQRPCPDPSARHIGDSVVGFAGPAIGAWPQAGGLDTIASTPPLTIFSCPRHSGRPDGRSGQARIDPSLRGP